MEICGQNQLQNYSTRINICISDYKTADDCDCEFIKPVSGFECQLCNIFLRNGYKIQEHIKTFQHMKIYEIHLQEHFQHRHGINTNQSNISAQKSTESLTTKKNDAAKECIAINDLKQNLISDHGMPEKSDHQVGTMDLNRRRTDLSGVIKRLHESGTRNRTHNVVDDRRIAALNDEPGTRKGTQSVVDEGSIAVLNDGSGTRNNVFDNRKITVLSDESVTRNGTHNLVDDRGITVLNDGLTMQSRYETLNRNHGEHCSDLTGVQRSMNHAAKDDFCDSGSGQISVDLSDGCKTLNVIEKVGISEERLMKREDDSVVYIDAKVSTTTEHGGMKENGEMRADTKASLEGEQQGAGQIEKIKEEVCDGDSVDDDGGVMGGFLEDRNDVLNNQNEYYNREIMPGYTIDQESQTISTISCSKQISTISTSAAGSSIGSEETHTVTTPVSDNPWPSFVRLENERRERFGGNLAADNSENDGDVNKSGDAISSVKELREQLKMHQTRLRNGVKNRFRCDACGRVFNRAGNLARHREIHSGERQFSCSICNTTLKTSRQLEQHKRLHDGKYVFPCNSCSKVFSFGGNLKKHERTHSGEKPFSCDICGKKFSSSSNCKRHQKSCDNT